MQLSILVLFACLQVAYSRLDRVNVKDGRFTSKDDGRTLMFRGINSVIKHYPWYDSKMLDPVRHQQLQDWGFNAIRLGMMWSGLEPAEGAVNETYVEIIKDIVDGLGDHGIYSYLDMHQDCLVGTDGYWGIPEWLVAKFERPAHSYPWPMKDTSGYTTWACGYFTEEISNAFDQLYTNKEGAADSFSNFWLQVATRFKDNPSVLGYELMNEPWTGDVYQDTSLLLPGNAGHHLLEPFYNKANDALRTVDNETMVFWEPVTYSYFVNSNPSVIVDVVLDAYLKTHNMSLFLPIISKVCGDLDPGFLTELESGNSLALDIQERIHTALTHGFNDITDGSELSKPSVFGPGFSAPPGGMEYLDRTVLSWHYYCWAIGYGGDEEFDPVLRAACDDFLGPMVFNTVKARATELGGSAMFLTEFGTCSPNATMANSTGTIECNFVLDQADLHLQSWSYWDAASGTVLWDNEGNPVEDRVKVFARPYPPATAGIPLHLFFDHETRMFEYTFRPDTSLFSPTEIFVSPLIYSEGFSVEVPEGVSWNVVQGQNKIAVTVASPADTVTVKINPMV